MVTNTKDCVIKEIKAGQEGYGLLIENDGYVSLSDNKPNINLREGVVEELGYINKWDIPYPYIVDVVLTKYDTPNANRRIYSESILRREVDAYQDRIRQRLSMGEYSHPEDSVLNGERATHLIIETKWVGKTLIGKMEILMSYDFMRTGRVSTLGDLVATQLYFQKMKLGVSTRGLGEVQYDPISDISIVKDNFSLICWDIVTEPSSKDSWITPNPKDLNLYIETAANQNEKLIAEQIKKLDSILK